MLLPPAGPRPCGATRALAARTHHERPETPRAGHRRRRIRQRSTSSFSRGIVWPTEQEQGCQRALTVTYEGSRLSEPAVWRRRGTQKRTDVLDRRKARTSHRSDLHAQTVANPNLGSWHRPRGDLPDRPPNDNSCVDGLWGEPAGEWSGVWACVWSRRCSPVSTRESPPADRLVTPTRRHGGWFPRGHGGFDVHLHSGQTGQLSGPDVVLPALSVGHLGVLVIPERSHSSIGNRGPLPVVGALCDG